MNDDLKKRAIIFWVVIVIGLAFLFPTLRVMGKSLLGWTVTADERIGGNWISRPISLGLDLKGGVRLVYRVRREEAVAGRLQVIANGIRRDLSTKNKIAVVKAKVLGKNELEIVLLSSRQVEQAKTAIGTDFKDLTFIKQSDQENGRLQLIYAISEKEAAAIERLAVSQAVETLRNRVDQFGVAEPLIQRVEEDRILLQMPGIQDIDSVKKVVGKVAKLEFRLLPRPGDTSGNTVMLKDRKDGGEIKVEDVIQLTGEYVSDARVTEDQINRREISLTFTSEGGKLFGKITGEAVGRQLAIILDGEVYSAPTIQERIGGGRCSITGDYSAQEAHELAVVLRAGSLPASLEVLEENTVGPALGAESIRKGIIAIIVSCVAIFLFTIWYYRKSGWVAVASLVVNLFLILAALSAFGATLTLPGLAGLALTVGMAVDSNVIIFERIRDELRNGCTRDAAVAAGFEKALSAIVDSNVTTLLAGLVLYFLGTGAIRGFAVTLSIGIVTTLYCAVFVSRLGFDIFPLHGKKNLSI